MAKSMAKTSQPKTEKAVTKSEVKTEVKPKTQTNKQQVEASKKDYAPTDTIKCLSVTHGELIMKGIKSDLMYTWAGFGDIAYVEYQDLFAAKTRKSDFIYAPYFVIEDDELLSQDRWADVKKFYDGMYTYRDANDILQLDLPSFQRAIETSPKGLQKAIQVEMVTQLENGTFDSLQKIKLMDDICGTDIMCYVK